MTLYYIIKAYALCKVESVHAVTREVYSVTATLYLPTNSEASQDLNPCRARGPSDYTVKIAWSF